MTEKIELKVGTPQKSEAENGPIWATPENLPFFKDENFPLFSYSYWSNVPKWKCAHILLCKKYKNCLKLPKIADLQPPDWIQRKKNTLYVLLCTLGWFKILIFWSWDLNTSHLIWTALMIISSYSEDFCHLLPLRASHRKFSGTVGDIENRTSPNPPFMGIQTSVCGHWSQRCMISGVLTCFCAQKRQKTMKNDYFPENSHFLQFFSIFRY